MTYAAFPLVEIPGGPYERGVAYRRAAAERIRRSVRLYADQMRGFLRTSCAASCPRRTNSRRT
jgi:hypothetical protein